MHQLHPVRGVFLARRSVSFLTVALAALVFAAACNDSDGAGAPIASGGSVGDAAGGAAAGNAGASGAAAAGAAGNNVASDAGSGGAVSGDAGAGGDGDAGAAGEPGQVTNCVAGGAQFVVGNYADTAGNKFILRTSAKAATFALIPAGAANPAKPPRLFLVDRICAPGGALIAKDESSSYRLDFRQTGSQLAVCLSAAAPTLGAALALPAADGARAADTGCSGKPFAFYTTEAL